MTKEQLQPYFRQFIEDLELKLERGRKEYGDSSFNKETYPLLQEIQEEIVDICGWSIILWTRLERIKESLENKSE